MTLPCLKSISTVHQMGTLLALASHTSLPQLNTLLTPATLPLSQLLNYCSAPSDIRIPLAWKASITWLIPLPPPEFTQTHFHKESFLTASTESGFPVQILIKTILFFPHHSTCHTG